MTVKDRGTLRCSNYVRSLFSFRCTIFVRSRANALGNAFAHVRCTTRTTAPMRAHAQRAVSAYGRHVCAAPQGRTADGAAVSQLSMYDLNASTLRAGLPSQCVAEFLK